MSRTRHIETANPDITLTTRDAVRLARVLEEWRPKRADAARTLRDEIRRARIVPPRYINGEIVTMHSLVRCRDGAGKTFDVLMVYPGESVDGVENVSILSPLGIALLGLSEGQTREYKSEDGSRAAVTVLEVSFQPEANLLEGVLRDFRADPPMFNRRAMSRSASAV